MPISKKILNHLDKNKIKYKVVPHKKVYTTYDLAETLREDLKKIAKTLLVKADKNYYLVVVPAHYQLDFAKLKKALKAKKVSLTTEKMMQKLLKVKPGAITPFGSMHDLQVLVDKTFSKITDILVGAGSFTESLNVKMKDLIKMEEPLLVSIGAVKKRKPAKKKTAAKKAKRSVPAKKPKKKAVKKRVVKRKK